VRLDLRNVAEALVRSSVLERFSEHRVEWLEFTIIYASISSFLLILSGIFVEKEWIEPWRSSHTSTSSWTWRTRQRKRSSLAHRAPWQLHPGIRHTPCPTATTEDKNEMASAWRRGGRREGEREGWQLTSAIRCRNEVHSLKATGKEILVRSLPMEDLRTDQSETGGRSSLQRNEKRNQTG
jgi:hypothetical protein